MKKLLSLLSIYFCLSADAQDTCVRKHDLDSIEINLQNISVRWERMKQQHTGSFPERKLAMDYDKTAAYLQRLKDMLKNKKAKICK